MSPTMTHETGYPFDQLPLPADETILFTHSHPSFEWDGSGFYEWTVLISNQALYFGAISSDYTKWRRFALADIQRATLKPGKYNLLLPIGALVIFLLIVSILFYLTDMSIFLSVLISPLGLGVFIFIVLEIVEMIKKGEPGTVDLHLQLSPGQFLWQSPDNDEKAWDRRILTKTLHKLAELGVATADEMVGIENENQDDANAPSTTQQ